MCVCVSATEFSEVLPPFFPPPTFSSVKVGGVVVVVGGCGGTEVVSKLIFNPSLSSLFL